jgi:ribosomal protein S27E
MSRAINCQSCGGANIYESGESSVKCDFCGSVINIPINETKAIKNGGESRLKTKPEITKPRQKKSSNPPNFGEPHNLVRVDNGWIAHFKNKPSKFVQDKIVFDYSNGGGELLLTRKNLQAFEDLFDWYTDTELQSIRFLDLSNNKLSDSYDISHLINLERLILKNNEITSTNFNIKSNELKKLDLSENLITTFNINTIIDTNSWKIQNILQIDLSKNKIQTIDFVALEVLIIDGISVNLDFTDNPVDLSDTIRKLKNKYPDGSPDLLSKINYGPLIRMKSGNYLKAKDFENKILFKMNIIDSKGSNHEIKIRTGNFSQLKEAYLKKYSTSFKDKETSFCFIATATMGSYDHPQVMELRHFRDEWILQKSWGESFVKWYYHYGAIAAKFIDKSYILKKFSYLLIVKPLVYLSRIVKK